MADDVPGQFVQLVQSGLTPRYVYTVADDEHPDRLLLAGAPTFNADEAFRLVLDCAATLGAGADGEQQPLEIDIGWVDPIRVTLQPVHSSWVDLLVPESRRGEYVQIIPVDHRTIDVVSMDRPYDGLSAGSWKWLTEPWEFDAPSSSKVATNLAALRGEPVTEAARWEDDYFEAFAGSGPDTPREEVRFVGFPPLVGADESLGAVASLSIGEAIRRVDALSPWLPWLPGGAGGTSR